MLISETVSENLDTRKGCNISKTEQKHLFAWKLDDRAELAEIGCRTKKVLGKNKSLQTYCQNIFTIQQTEIELFSYILSKLSLNVLINYILI